MAKIILFISAFVPMFVVFLVTLILEIINDNLRFNITNTLVFITLICLIFIGTIGLMFLIKGKKESTPHIKVISKKNITDQHFLNYFSLFVVLALTFDLSKICYIVSLMVILIFIAVVYIKNNIFYVNPLLNILGYSFYDIVCVEEGKEKEMRIFYKGQLDISKERYKIYKTNKNLYFMEEEDRV